MPARMTGRTGVMSLFLHGLNISQMILFQDVENLFNCRVAMHCISTIKQIFNRDLRTETCSDRRRRSTTCQNSEPKHVVIDAGDLLHVRTQNSFIRRQPHTCFKHINKIFPITISIQSSRRVCKFYCFFIGCITFKFAVA